MRFGELGLETSRLTQYQNPLPGAGAPSCGQLFRAGGRKLEGKNPGSFDHDLDGCWMDVAWIFGWNMVRITQMRCFVRILLQPCSCPSDTVGGEPAHPAGRCRFGQDPSIRWILPLSQQRREGQKIFQQMEGSKPQVKYMTACSTHNTYWFLTMHVISNLK